MCLIASPIVVQREAFGQSRTVTFSQSPVRVRGELFFTTPFISHAPSESLSGWLRVTSRSASSDGEMSEYDLLSRLFSALSRLFSVLSRLFSALSRLFSALSRLFSAVIQ